MKQEQATIQALDRSIADLFGTALRIGLDHPSLMPFLYRTLQQQKRAARVRRQWEERGLHVPAFMIASVTNRCNLRCSGCYARAHHRPPQDELSGDQLRRVIAEADELGIGIILLAGGEPLTRPELLDITGDFPGIIFPLFTNGLLIDEETIGKLKRQPHVVPVISLEGRETGTDGRRGPGVFTRLGDTMANMAEAGIVFGTSLTVTRQNFATVVDVDYVRERVESGCRLFVFVDYVPVQEGTDGLTLTAEQRVAEADAVTHLRAEFPGCIFIAFPGGEEEFGGCLAAGRGFVHVSAEGRVEPCPFSPFSDASLKEMSLKEALQSEFLRAIREGGVHLSEANGGCALWENREEVAALLGQEAAIPAPELGPFIARRSVDLVVAG